MHTSSFFSYNTRFREVNRGEACLSAPTDRLAVLLQGDDYILYCHPNRQKTPRSDRLREWYHMLLRQAKSEGIVTYLSNLFDTFFEGGKDHRVDKPSVLHMPYFEGDDYWSPHLCCLVWLLLNWSDIMSVLL